MKFLLGLALLPLTAHAVTINSLAIPSVVRRDTPATSTASLQPSMPMIP